MNFNNGRVIMEAAAREQRAAQEVLVLGHCPGGVDLSVLRAHPTMLNDIEGLGYRREVEALATLPPVPTPLYNLPLPIDSLNQFQQLFPGADAATQYRSRLAGARAWLPQAVADCFRSQSGDGLRLWVICVDEALGQAGFLPHAEDDWLDPQNASAFTRALAVPSAGILLLPDLERLQVPAQLADVPRLRLPNPVPQFLPCSTNLEDDHRERRNEEEMPDAPPVWGFSEIVGPLLQHLARRRPDLHCVLSLPLDAEQSAEQLQPSQAALADISQLQNSRLADDLHRLQVVYPHLRSPMRSLMSASALLAGHMAAQTRRLGAWHSVAGINLADDYQPYPLLRLPVANRLQEDYGLGVLTSLRGRLQLSDERLMGGVFGEHSEHSKSGEVARFLGWLRRELEGWGLQLLFQVDPNDSRPEIALRDFFARLYQLGALRGRLPENAFSIHRVAAADNTLIFNIDIAPAFPIDRIRLNLSHERLEVSHG